MTWRQPPPTLVKPRSSIAFGGLGRCIHASKIAFSVDEPHFETNDQCLKRVEGATITVDIARVVAILFTNVSSF